MIDTDPNTTDTLRRHAPQIRARAGSGLLALTVLAALPAFWFGLAALGREWVTPEYSHGPLIPVFAGFLLLRSLRDTPPADKPGPGWPGLALVLVGLALAYIGTQGRIGDIVAYGLVPFIGGLILIALGWPRARHGILPTLMLIFMLPLPQLIYWKVTLLLQAVSSRIGVAVIELASVPVFLDGNVIDLGVYKLQVAEACSGLQYLIPVMSLALMLAILYRGPTWHRVVLLAAAAPVTVGLNALRIGLVGISVDRFGIGAAEGLLHVFEGWVILLACVSVLLLILILLHRTIPASRRPCQILDLDSSGFGTVVAGIGQVNARPTMISAALISIAVAAALLVLPKPGDATPARSPFALFPSEIAGSLAVRRALDPDIARVLAADDYLDATYYGPNETGPVNFFASYYIDQSDGSGMHSPEVCLPANGWEIASFARHTLVMPQTPYSTFEVNRATIRKGLQQQLVYYWFEGRDRRETNDVVAKIVVLWDALRTGRTDGALIRFITPIDDGNVAGAEARLTAFIGAALPALPDFVPR